MKAVVYEAVDRAVLTDVPEPRPKPGEVLVKVAYVGVCGTDVHIVEGLHNRATPPVVLGHEFSGMVADPNGVAGWSTGDRVAVEPLTTCGRCVPCRTGRYNICPSMGIYGVDTDGALATYVSVRADRLHRVPEGVTLREAAFAEPLAVVCHLLRLTGAPVVGDLVLVFGGGPIGAIAADVARAAGARTVVAERQGFRREFARAGGHLLWDETPWDEVFGGDPPLDGAAQPSVVPAAGGSTAVASGTSGGSVIGLEATGTSIGLDTLVATVPPGGRIGVVGLPKGANTIDMNAVIAKEIQLVGSRVYTSRDFTEALRLIERADVAPDRFITRVVGLDEAIEGGLRAVAEAGDVMKVLVDVGGADE